jgi:predicted alpha/beta-fold hydrolase
MSLAGHFWTIAPSLRQQWLPREAPPSEAWSTTLLDPQLGPVTLTGSMRTHEGADTCLLVVHGLGGTTGTHYCVAAAHAAHAAGFACLRVALRGADRLGEDFYHAGLSEDLDAALRSEALASFRRVLILGFSMGGHVTLRWALAAHDARVTAVAAVCAPLDLELSARHIDAPAALIYRRHVLHGLKEIYAAVAARRPVPTPLPDVMACDSIREWDRLAVVPRHGFASVDDYYARVSVGPRLPELQVPALLLQSNHDPMVPPRVYARHLQAPTPKLTVRRVNHGGHVGFAPRHRVAESLVEWLRDQ